MSEGVGGCSSVRVSTPWIYFVGSEFHCENTNVYKYRRLQPPIALFYFTLLRFSCWMKEIYTFGVLSFNYFLFPFSLISSYYYSQSVQNKVLSSLTSNWIYILRVRPLWNYINLFTAFRKTRGNAIPFRQLTMCIFIGFLSQKYTQNHTNVAVETRFYSYILVQHFLYFFS